jgi:hypothetical protein
LVELSDQKHPNGTGNWNPGRLLSGRKNHQNMNSRGKKLQENENRRLKNFLKLGENQYGVRSINGARNEFEPDPNIFLFPNIPE